MAHPELREAGREGETGVGPAPVRTVALVAICLGYFMTILDTTIVTVALPNVGHELGVALLGGLVNRHGFFVPGMHMNLVIAGGAFLIGCLLTLRAVSSGPSHGEAP
ncbi:MAG: hypothetical protein M3Z66_03700 [Chloroflexota bacterium]|nr:hypothetical protein [Chloroflexota bacterium]